MNEQSDLLLIGLTFFLAGVVKGIVGLGLPTVSLGLLALFIDLPTAMALMLVPSLVTNIWQATSGGFAVVILSRIWPFLLAATASIFVGAIALVNGNPSLLLALLAVLLMFYAGIGLAGLKLSIQAQHRASAGVVFGIANGVLTGMTGSFTVPGVIYLNAIGLDSRMLIQAMGILFTLSTVGLAIALQRYNLLSPQQMLISSVGVLPALIGMLGGKTIRERMTEAQFKRVFFLALLVLGAVLMVKAV
ncbi:MAG: sulfite exporter TauE/SafE family protein [Pseudomonadota bacterium]